MQSTVLNATVCMAMCQHQQENDAWNPSSKRYTLLWHAVHEALGSLAKLVITHFQEDSNPAYEQIIMFISNHFHLGLGL